MAKVVALDLATMTGVAVGSPGASPFWWTEDLGEGDGRLARLIRIVHAIVTEHRPTEIAIEAPMLNGMGKAAHTLKFLIQANGVVRAAARIARVPVKEEAVNSIRKHFLGQPPKGRDNVKRATIARCHAIGWKVTDDNQADALALWDMRCAILDGKHAVATSALFSGLSRSRGA